MCAAFGWFSSLPASPRDSLAPRCHCVESVQKEPTHPIFPLAWMQTERERMCFVREFPWLLAWEGDVIDAHSSPLLQCFHKLEEPMCSHMTRRKPQAYQCHSRIHPHPNRYSSLVFHCHSIIHNFSTFKQCVIAYYAVSLNSIIVVL